MDDEDDATARNRAQNPRRTPDRTPVGWELTSRWIAITAGVVVVATVVLVVVLVLGGG